MSSAVDEIAPDEQPRYCRAGDALWRTAGSGILVLPAGAKGPVAVVGAGRALWDVLASPMTLDAAARAVSAIVATGIIPAALEMIDQATIRAVESSIYAAGYPTDAAAALLIELDGALAGLEEDALRARRVGQVLGGDLERAGQR